MWKRFLCLEKKALSANSRHCRDDMALGLEQLLGMAARWAPWLLVARHPGDKRGTLTDSSHHSSSASQQRSSFPSHMPPTQCLQAAYSFSFSKMKFTDVFNGCISLYSLPRIVCVSMCNSICSLMHRRCACAWPILLARESLQCDPCFNTTAACRLHGGQLSSRQQSVLSRMQCRTKQGSNRGGLTCLDQSHMRNMCPKLIFKMAEFALSLPSHVRNVTHM